MKPGQVVEVQVRCRGSELVAAAASAATTLTAADATPFDAGALVRIDGNTYTITAVAEVANPSDPDSTNATLTITPGLVGAVVDGTPVDLWTGDQVLDDVVLQVAMGVGDETGDSAGDPIPVTVDLNQRKDWSALEGPVDPPIAVLLTDDLTELVDAPGYTPPIDLTTGVAFPDPAAVALVAPAESPVITAIVGDATGLTVVTDPILPTTLLDYQINGVTVAADQRTPVLHLDSDGTNPLALGTDYAVTVVAHNAAGGADPSASRTARLDPGVPEAAIYAMIQAGGVITGFLQVGPVMIDPSNGFVLTGLDGRQTILNGVKNNFVGEGTFDAATILGKFLMLGKTTLSNDLLLGSGVTDPVDSPAGANYYDVDYFASTGYRRRGLASDGTNWVTTDYVSGQGNVQLWAKSDGSAQGSFPILQYFGTDAPYDPLGGVAIIGAGSAKRYWVLGKDYTDDGYWRLTAYTSAGVRGTSFRITALLNGESCTVGTDGTNLLVARRLSTGELVMQTYDTSASLLSALSLGTSSAWAGATVTGITKSAVDTATVRYVVTTTAGIFVFNTGTGARVASEEWPAGTAVYGIANDGSWHTFNGETQICNYTSIITTALEWAYSQVDNNPAGLGTAETLVGPRTLITLRKRAMWRISAPSPPQNDGTTDGANTLALYAAPTGSPLIQQAVLTPGSLYADFTTPLATSGTAPQTTSGFASRPGALGKIYNSAGFFVDGAGNGDWPGKLTKSGTVSSGAATTTNASGYCTLTVAPGFTPRDYQCFNDNSRYLVKVDRANSTATSIRVYFRDVAASGAVVASTNVGDIRWVAIP